jgi:putative pyruvate formate lyase activating enzyme
MICKDCPRECGIDREKVKGFCGMGEKPVVARAFLHMWEEPCISGTMGSGAVFFSGCNLKCIFCQNHEISRGGCGREISEEELARLFLSLQSQGAHNINLVTPSHFIPAVKKAIELSKAGMPRIESSGRQAGFDGAAQTAPAAQADAVQTASAESAATGSKDKLHIPVVYNTNAYDGMDSLHQLEGLIDIYLPDLKYIKTETAEEYSGAANYFEHASKAILEMYRQAGAPVFDESGMMRRGVIIRHLVLPGHISETLRILEWIAENLPDVYVSLMSQYIPCYKACGHKVLGRRLTRYEYEKVLNKYIKLGLNGFVQERESASAQYIPDFNMKQF